MGKHIQELYAPEPEMPPFDEAKLEPINGSWVLDRILSKGDLRDV
jgi:hypothetical protein